jgi:hypothetical protein
MAERRMFAKTIIDSDAFLDMPQSTQLLYFHLAMRADDDGFINNPKSIMRNVGCKEDDLKLLAAKKFILPFESGVIVIKHWRIHNYIQKDRYHGTKYKEELDQLKLDENGAYTRCIQDVSKMDTQVRLELGKDRLGKDREEPPIESAHTRFKKPTLQEVLDYCKERRNTVNAQRFIDYYESKGWKVGRDGMKDWKASVRTWETSEKAKPSPPSYSVTLPDWQKKLSGAAE